MTGAPVEGRFSLDTNILVYSVDSTANGRRRAAIELVQRAARADCVLTLQALAEFYSVASRRSILAAPRAREAVQRLGALFEVAAGSPEDLREAILAVEEHRLSFWDATLWAAARRSGCAAILTEDFRDGQELGGVRFVNPFRPENRRRIEALLAN